VEKKATMSALEVEENALQSEISALQRTDGINPPHGFVAENEFVISHILIFDFLDDT
jgi:hypothetical protein